jgi:hypothetical protein
MNKVLFGLLVILSMSTFANCDVKLNLSKDFVNNFELYDGQSCNGACFFDDLKREIIVDRRLKILPRKIKRMLSKKQYKLVSSHSNANYELNLDMDSGWYSVRYALRDTVNDRSVLSGREGLSADDKRINNRASIRMLKRIINELPLCSNSETNL